MTNRELGNTIRKELKKNGFNRNDISVKVRDSLYDTAVNIRIKNPMIRKSEVEAIAKKYDEIDRDERTGEILAGANTFVFVEYEYGIFQEVSAALLPTAEMVLNNKEKYSGHAIAKNEEKEIHITHYQGNEWTLTEFAGTAKTSYIPPYWIRCPQDLATAIWRFKNIGTIYA